MKIALIGYGKMGHMVEEIAMGRGHEIVCRIEVDNTADMDSDSFRSADVAIEFSSPAAAYGNVMSAFAQGVKVVSGTTGWYAQHEEELKTLCRDGAHTLFWSSNFSVGVAITRSVSRRLAQLMSRQPDYAVSLSETHHVHKLDAPSGTAITLAEDIEAELGHEVPITSYREGEVPGIHTVTCDGPFDTITLTHSAKNRRGFALGAVLAAEYALDHEGLLGMNDLFPL